MRQDAALANPTCLPRVRLGTAGKAILAFKGGVDSCVPAKSRIKRSLVAGMERGRVRRRKVKAWGVVRITAAAVAPLSPATSTDMMLPPLVGAAELTIQVLFATPERAERWQTKIAGTVLEILVAHQPSHVWTDQKCCLHYMYGV
jgi:hypothetical protein